ncbi:lysozyme [Caulobacter sp. X]|uniref:lysozyme n=1 Tax=Caulobacter sp. X TaxID=2048901 RepID=UPI000C15AB6F|nr:lysozyme [Caulobacter sp. X]PIC00894.1 muraminidase [Caulobacter sp. X]
MPTPSARGVPACALALIKRFEGLHDGDKATAVLEPQADPVGLYTVGWGHALFVAGKPVRDRETAYRLWRARWPAGMVRADADALLKADAQAVCDKVVALFPRTPLSDGQLGAMVSLAYNIGVGEVGGGPDFADSSVRRKLIAGDVAGAADAFRLWRFAGGRELPGLVARREAERAVFLGHAA